MISVSQAQAGDLLFWGAAGSTHHVAISLGGNQYIHAPRPGQTVSVGIQHTTLRALQLESINYFIFINT